MKYWPFLLLAGFFSCEFFYEPEKATQPNTDNVQAQNNDFSIYSINSGKQICNESISQDPIRFKGSMLWLGFAGELNVVNPPEGYSTANIKQHDRLTISNQKNEVLWFFLKDSLPGAECELQDPEWSTHPELVVTLAAKGDCGNNPEHGAVSISTLDKSVFWWNKHKLHGTATPHLWASKEIHLDSLSKNLKTLKPQYDSLGFVSQSTVLTAFGSKEFVFTWAEKTTSLSIAFIDYRLESPQKTILNKPESKENWKAESPLISPDGNWVAYNLYQSIDYYETYIQALKKDSKPHLISINASSPHWWQAPNEGQLALVYAELAPSHSIIFKEDYKSSELWNGSLGKTLLQNIQLNSELPHALQLNLIGEPIELAPLPFKGGLSPDGTWLASGTNDAWMMELK